MNKYYIKAKSIKLNENGIHVKDVFDIVRSNITGFKNMDSFRSKFMKKENWLVEMQRDRGDLIIEYLANCKAETETEIDDCSEGETNNVNKEILDFNKSMIDEYDYNNKINLFNEIIECSENIITKFDDDELKFIDSYNDFIKFVDNQNTECKLRYNAIFNTNSVNSNKSNIDLSDAYNTSSNMLSALCQIRSADFDSDIVYVKTSSSISANSDISSTMIKFKDKVKTRGRGRAKSKSIAKVNESEYDETEKDTESDSSHDSNSDSESEPEPEDDDGTDGYIPILIVPCRGFSLPSTEMEEYFIAHYRSCNICDITNNNNTELSALFDKSNIEVLNVTESKHAYLNPALESYHDMEKIKPICAENGPFIRVVFINNKHLLYNKCLLVIWTR